MNAEIGILWPALAAGLLVVATHVPLGIRVLERGIVFIDLTIAQVAALGGIVLGLLGGPEEGWAVTAAAGVAALLAAGLLAWTEHALHDVQEALIGSLYVLAASAAILLVAHNPHGAEHFEEMLSGQILWVRAADLWPLAIISAPLLAAWALWARHRPLAFYFVFAIAVMASVRVIGVFLVFATLILPALAVHGLSERRGLAAGFGLAVAGYALGLWLSVPLDLPAGPLIVCTLGALALGAAIVRKLVSKA